MVKRIKFHALNPQANKFPNPLLPVLPIFELFKFFKFVNASNPSAFSESLPLFTNGRSSLANALQLIGISNENSVLLPAYHCGSMVEPAIWLGTNIYFYKLDENLSPDLDHIRKLIQLTKNPIKALIVTHFFGFVQPLGEISKICKEFNISLVEDCAHAYYSSINGTKSGTVGDYAIASQRKFIPVSEGGGLIVNTINNNEFFLKRVSIKTEIKLLYNCLENAALFNRLGLLGKLINTINGIREKLESNKIPKLKNEQTISFLWFTPGTVNIAGGIISKFIIHFSAHQNIIKCRRNNYNYLLKKINDLIGVEPLYKKLSDGTVPYMFPMIIKVPSKYFVGLKMNGIPIWRWEELAESECSVSQYYRTHLLHLPCHQSLEKSDLDWMISEISAVLNKS